MQRSESNYSNNRNNDTLSAEKPKNIQMKFDRDNGFEVGQWDSIKLAFTENGYNLVKKYTKRIEDELDFRFITSKKIEIGIFVTFCITSVLLFTLQSIQSGLIFVASLVFLIYLLSIIKAKKLSKLIKNFNNMVSDLDESYFAIKITNLFGKREPWFYALVPFIKPDIAILIEAREVNVR